MSMKHAHNAKNGWGSGGVHGRGLVVEKYFGFLTSNKNIKTASGNVQKLLLLA